MTDTSWDLIYEEGIALMEEEDAFDEALTLLDKAGDLRGPVVQTFATRAVVLDRLRDLERSFGGKNADALSLTARGEARLFEILQELPPAIRSLLLSPFSLSSSSSFEDQIALSEDVLRNSRGFKNVIDTLPSELLTQVGRHLVHELAPPSGDLAFALVSVSRRWRSIFVQDPTLWGNLVVHRGESRRKVQAFLDKGPLKTFELKHANDLEGVFQVLKGNVSSITRFDSCLDEDTGFEQLWNLWRTSFTGAADLPFSVTHLTLWKPPSYYTSPIPATSPSLILPSLVELSITGFVFSTRHSLFPLLQQLPNLQTLRLKDSTLNFVDWNSSHFFLPTPTILSLPNLNQISFRHCDVSYATSVAFLLPSLLDASADDTVDLSPFFFPPPPHPPNASNITSLVNWSPQLIPELTFISRLNHFRSLRCLDLSSSPYTDATLDALNWPHTSLEAGCCPLLEELDLAQMGRITGAALIRLVNSRGKWFELGRCSRVARVDVTGSPGVDETAKDWLRQGVGALIDRFEDPRARSRRW